MRKEREQGGDRSRGEKKYRGNTSQHLTSLFLDRNRLKHIEICNVTKSIKGSSGYKYLDSVEAKIIMRRQT